MLYVTTRNNRDAYTARRVLTEGRGADGGFYLPFRAPAFSPEALDMLLGKPFNQCVAEVLSMLFQTEITGWDVDFSIGRYPVRMTSLRHRIHLGECWHNPDGDFARVQRNLAAHLQAKTDMPGNWCEIAVRIAVLFGIFGDLRRSGIAKADIAVVSGDFSAPISAWYARQWGLPVENIICCCNENKNLWDLICHGQMRTDTVSIATVIPEADVTLPDNLERLIYACGGTAEVKRYLDACRKGRIFSVSDPIFARLRNGLYVSVVSSQRILTTIPSVYRTHGYLLSPASALAYSGLLDYRAKTGNTGHAVILADRSPLCDDTVVARSMEMTTEELRELFS